MNHFNSILILILVLSPSVVFGQKNAADAAPQSYGIFQTQGEYFQFMGTLKREGAGNPELMAMVPMINDVVLERPFGSTGNKYNAASSTLDLLADPSVRKDLEMVDSQYEELQKANESIQRQAVDQLRSLELSNLKNVTDRILAIRDQSENKLQETLLPHQMDRLRQILAQSQLRRRSLVDILTSEPLKSRLEITDTQSKELKEEEKEIEEDLQKQIAQLRAEARKRLLSKLKSRQQEQVEQLFGDTFDFSQTVNKKDRK